jgi:hypothetical protein
MFSNGPNLKFRTRDEQKAGLYMTSLVVWISRELTTVRLHSARWRASLRAPVDLFDQTNEKQDAQDEADKKPENDGGRSVTEASSRASVDEASTS